MPRLKYKTFRAPSGLTLEEYFWAHVDKDGPIPVHRPELGPCWIWKGTITSHGYACIQYNGVTMQAHVFAHELLIGPAPTDDLKNTQRDHLCKNKACPNPWHLEIVTRRENILRSDSPTAINARKEVCDKGHDALISRPDGKRRCAECHRQEERNRYLEKKARGLHSGSNPAADNASKTHCMHGHELSGDNLGIKPNGKGRYCKQCSRLASQVRTKTKTEKRRHDKQSK